MNRMRFETKKGCRAIKTVDGTIGVCLLFFSSSGTAFAYIDPGSATVIITAILGLVGAATYTVRRAFSKFWSRFFGGTSSERQQSETSEKERSQQ